MTDEIERAADIWRSVRESASPMDWKGAFDVLFPALAPPPEERHKSLTLADLFEVCEKLAEDVRLLKFPPEAAPEAGLTEQRLDDVTRSISILANRDDKILMWQDRHDWLHKHSEEEAEKAKYALPAATEAAPEPATREERTAWWCPICEHNCVKVYQTAQERVLRCNTCGGALASSSPTATAQRGECIHAWKDFLSGISPTKVMWCSGCGELRFNVGDSQRVLTPDPLPAQTEPGERRCPQCDAIIPGLRRFCTTCGMSTPLDLPKGLRYSDNADPRHPKPEAFAPSPAPECAHEQAEALAANVAAQCSWHDDPWAIGVVGSFHMTADGAYIPCEFTKEQDAVLAAHRARLASQPPAEAEGA